MTATIDITESTVMKAVGDFLVLTLGLEVVRGQENQTPMPQGQFVAMTSGTMTRKGTNVRTYVDPGTNPGAMKAQATQEVSVQLDVYGKDAQANANILSTLFRDGYAVDAFPAGIAPCYAGDPQQIPLVTGEENWLERWKLDLVLSVVPTVSVPQDFADELEIGTAGNPVTKNTPINGHLPSVEWNGLHPLK
jgi:hypothetical protein